MIPGPPASGGACAASAMAARSATWRAVKSAGVEGTAPVKSTRARTAEIHRRSVTHPVEAATPTTRHGLIAARTVRAGNRFTPNSASAAPIALAVYSRPCRVSAGVTVSVAPHRHRYRRTITITIVAGPPASTGPRCWRSRSPWPWMPTPAPAGRPAAPQAGHCDGRTASTDGVAPNHRLTLIPLRMIDLFAPSPLCTGVSEHRPGGRLTVLRVTYFQRPLLSLAPPLSGIPLPRSPSPPILFRDGPDGLQPLISIIQPDRSWPRSHRLACAVTATETARSMDSTSTSTRR